MDKAVLIVGFGSSVKDAINKSIDTIEKEFALYYSDRCIYRAFTSNIVIKRLFEVYGLKVNTVRESMSEMLENGVRDLIVQPTYITDGIENQALIEAVNDYREYFDKIRIGKPLIMDRSDCEKTVDIVMRDFCSLKNDTAVVFIGHGTNGSLNSIYDILENTFLEKGYKNVIVGTIRGVSPFDSLIAKIRLCGVRKIILVPFMLVAGKHVADDIFGEGEGAYRSILENMGYEVSCVMRGLGEIEGIRNLFIEHSKKGK